MELGLAATGCTAADVDKVFDTYDEDGGGYMDEDEAAAMIKGLQVVSEQADHEIRVKERAARGMRAKATKKATEATEPMPEPEPLPTIVESPKSSPAKVSSRARAHASGVCSVAIEARHGQ